MENSVFSHLVPEPQTTDLELPLGESLQYWNEICDFVRQRYPTALEQWFVSAKKFGWSFRIKDKKRAIVYLSPLENKFWLTMIFGQKATDSILSSPIDEGIKTELMSSKVYMEGRVLLLSVSDPTLIGDIKQLIEIKLAN